MTKKRVKLKDEELAHAKLPPLPAYVTGESDQKKNAKAANPDESILEEQKAVIKSLEDEIQKYLDNIYEATGMSRSALSKFLKNQSNFSREDWEMIQKQKLELLEEFHIPQKDAQEYLKGEEKRTTKRKIKTSPRRGWLPMK